MFSPNQRGFKFLPIKFRKYFLNGYVRMGSLNYYRLLEIFTDDDQIGDKREGVRDTLITTRIDAQSDPKISKQLSMDIKGNSVVEIIDCVQTVLLDCHAFCFSSSIEENVIDRFCRSRPDSYDACVEIRDLNAFMNAMLATGKIGDTPLKKAFFLAGKNVEYINVATHEFSSTMSIGEPDPFIKGKKYEEDNEARITLSMINGQIIESDFVTVQFEPPPGLLEIVPISNSSRIPLADNPTVVVEHELDRIRQCLSEWYERPSHPVSDIYTLDDSQISAFYKNLNDEELAAFQAYRRRLGNAYWKIRNQFGSRDVDHHFLINGVPRFVINRLCDTLNARGIPGPPLPRVPNSL